MELLARGVARLDGPDVAALVTALGREAGLPAATLARLAEAARPRSFPRAAA